MRLENMREAKILVADDEAETVKRIGAILKSAGFSNVETTSSIQSFSQLDGFDILFVDIVWPQGSRPRFELSEYFGLSAMRYIKNYNPDSKIILMSKHLFDLDHLTLIQEADSFLKSTSSASEVLEKVSFVISLSNQKFERMTLILKQAILDGRADLFNIDKDSYNELVDSVNGLEYEVLKGRENKEKWNPILSKIERIIPNVKNLIDIISTLKNII